MDLDQKVLALENRIIDFCTMVTWWIEVRFDKDNVYIAIMLSVFRSLVFLLALPQLSIFLFEEDYLIASGVINILIVFVFFRVLSLIIFQSFFTSALKAFYPQGSPNPCRFSGRHSLERRISIGKNTIWFFIFLYGYKPFLFYIFFAGFIRSFLLFFLACDSIPPTEKARRKNAHELGAFVPEP